MSRKEFISMLRQEGIDPNQVAFNDSISTGYNIRRNSERWQAFYRERGKEYNCVDFHTESDALQFVYRLLVFNDQQIKKLKMKSQCAV